MTRKMPTEPGWWWASFVGLLPVPVRVFHDVLGGSGLAATHPKRGTTHVEWSGFGWLSPIAPHDAPTTADVLREVVEELCDDYRRRAKSCRDMAFGAPSDEYRRLAAKASAYEHAAELLEARCKTTT